LLALATTYLPFAPLLTEKGIETRKRLSARAKEAVTGRAQGIVTVPGGARGLPERDQGEILAVVIPLEREIIVMAAEAAAEPGDGGARPR